MKKKKIKSLIFGISGQDGSYLSHFLINKGYDVCGTTRNSSKNNLKNLVRLGVLNKVKIIRKAFKNLGKGKAKGLQEQNILKALKNAKIKKSTECTGLRDKITITADAIITVENI